MRFTVGHGPQHNSSLTNGIGANGGSTSTAFTQADLFGSELLLPAGTIVRRGMTFKGTASDGGVFRGTINNELGAGYSKLDGFGIHQCQSRGPRSFEVSLDQSWAKRQAGVGLPFFAFDPLRKTCYGVTAQAKMRLCRCITEL